MILFCLSLVSELFLVFICNKTSFTAHTHFSKHTHVKCLVDYFSQCSEKEGEHNVLRKNSLRTRTITKWNAMYAAVVRTLHDRQD